MSSKKKNHLGKKLLSMAMVLVLSMTLLLSVSIGVAAETTANEAVNEVANSILQIVMTYEANGKKYWCGYGSAFLINDSTILTCAHNVEVDEVAKQKGKAVATHFGETYDKNNFGYLVTVKGQITIDASLKKADYSDDYAILTLNEAINTKSIAKLGDSSTVKKTQPVYALGFPWNGAAIQKRITYTRDQVEITSGFINNIAQGAGTLTIDHSAAIKEGNSGGPLVDENGAVIGVNSFGIREIDTGEQIPYYYAADINNIKETLDLLGIEYTAADGSTDVETTVAQEDETESDVVETEPATEPVVEQSEGINVMQIVIIAIVAVLIIALIVIVLVVVMGKKKSDKKPTPQPPMGGMPTPPQPPMGGQSPYQRQPVPPAPIPPTAPSNEGAGETSVLNDGAGETTVLGGQSTNFFIVRKSNNERVNINKPEFVIGKEKRKVDYCISNNNSVSRAHAKIRVRAGRCYIVDLNSTNCTFVNNTKLSPNQEVILSAGDKIKISDEEFEFLG